MNFGLAEYSELILLVLIVSVLILALLQLVLAVRMAKTNKRTKKLWAGTNKDNVENTMLSLLNEIDDLRQQNRDLTNFIKDLEKKVSFHISRSAIVRYNAFGERGNDLSFSIALLNDYDDGVVITSIYNRDQSTTYAKPIDKGTSAYPLSTEETQAIAKAKNN